MVGSSYTSKSHHHPEPEQVEHEFDMNVGLVNQQKLSLDNLLEASLTPSKLLTPSSLQLPELTFRVSTKSSAFGRGMLLTDLDGKAIVSLVDDSGSGDVIQSVLASVLNGSSVLDISHSGREEYYFLKSDGLRSLSTDQSELQRLSGTYNITLESIKSTQGRQLCAANRLSSICILYGLDKRIADRYAHRRAHKLAVRSAWKKEAEKLKEGHQLLLALTPWTPAQRNELAQRGEVRGFQGIEIHSVHKYPQLIGQSSNIKFVRDNSGKRRH